MTAPTPITSLSQRLSRLPGRRFVATSGWALTALTLCGLSGCGTPTSLPPAKVTVRFEHVGSPFETPAGATVEPLLGPVAWVVLAEDAPTPFDAGSVASSGLEDLAERGDPSALAAELAQVEGALDAGGLTTAEGSYEAGAIGPGQSFTLTLDLDGQPRRIWFASMFVQSNDLFLAPVDGILVEPNEDNPVLELWDAGTEVNEAPGEGPNQAPRQAHPDAGQVEAKPIAQIDDEFSYPPPAALMELIITPIAE